MTHNYRELCEELLGALENEGHAHWPGGPDGDPLIEQARAALADEASKMVSQPTPPSAGEVGELVAWLRETGDLIQPNHLAEHQRYKRAADLLEQRHPAPVPVSERPWEREGWCDRRGQCWMGHPGGGGFIPSWRLCRPEDAPSMRVSLPATALPLPQGEVQT